MTSNVRNGIDGSHVQTYWIPLKYPLFGGSINKKRMASHVYNLYTKFKEESYVPLNFRVENLLMLIEHL
jgi:hypothetical protein